MCKIRGGPTLLVAICTTLQLHNHVRPSSWVEDHRATYLFLRHAIHFHYASGNANPTLHLLPNPVGALSWTPPPSTIIDVLDPSSHPDTIDKAELEEEEWDDIRTTFSESLLMEDAH